MMVELVNLPTWCSLLLIVVLPTLSFAGLSFWVCHHQDKGVYPLGSEGARDIGGYLFSIVGLILGFILVNCWDDMKLAKLDLVNETQKLVVISRLMEQFPPAARDDVRSALVEYVDLAATEEWPTMVQGRPKPFARPAIRKLYHIFAHLEAKTPTQLEVYTNILPILDTIVELRNRRLWLSGATLPAAMWWMVLLGYAVSLAVLTFFPPVRPGNYPALIGMFTFMLSLLVYVIIILEYPYSGDVRVEPTLMLEVRTAITEP